MQKKLHYVTLFFRAANLSHLPKNLIDPLNLYSTGVISGCGFGFFMLYFYDI